MDPPLTQSGNCGGCMVQRITDHFLSCFRVAVPEAQYHRHRALPFTAHEALLFVSVHRRRNMSFVTIIVLRLCSPRCRSLSGWRWYFFSPTSREARRTAARDAFATRLTPLLRVSTHPPTHPTSFRFRRHSTALHENCWWFLCSTTRIVHALRRTASRATNCNGSAPIARPPTRRSTLAPNRSREWKTVLAACRSAPTVLLQLAVRVWCIHAGECRTTWTVACGSNALAWAAGKCVNIDG